MIEAASKKTIMNIAAASAIAIFFVADRVLKSVALLRADKEAVQMIPGLLSFDFTKNFYISFSLPLSGPWLIAGLGLVIACLAAYIVYLAKHKKGGMLEILLFSTIFLGALSNLADRLSHGYVIDYLELRGFSVFNLADVMITAAALALIMKNFREMRKR